MLCKKLAKMSSTCHRNKFHVIWRQTSRLLEFAARAKAKVAIEWPSSCTYWKLDKIIKSVTKYQLKKARFNGCQLGLRRGRLMPAGGPRVSGAVRNGRLMPVGVHGSAGAE